jgi:hypothetical protein
MPEVSKGQVGLSTGGSMPPPPMPTDLHCDAGEVVVGIATDMSVGLANGGQGRSARGIRIECATLLVDASGAHEGIIASHDVDGNGGANWEPSLWTLPAQCAQGGVVTMLETHGGATGNMTNLFMDTSLVCSTLGVQGTVIGTAAIAVPDGATLSGMNASTATCGAGSQIVRLIPKVGAGLDSVEVVCAPTICR